MKKGRLPEERKYHKLVESNNAKILGSYITDTKNRGRISVSLKLNIDNLDAVKQTFERYNYVVSAHYQPTDSKDRQHIEAIATTELNRCIL